MEIYKKNLAPTLWLYLLAAVSIIRFISKMVVTELALLRLLPPTMIDDTVLRSKLANAKRVMENYTKRRFYFAQQIEDPAMVYVIGEWDSLGQHMEEFIPSEANQALLDSLKDELTVEWLIHIAVPHEDLPLAKAVSDVEQNVLSIGRHFVLDGKRDDFERLFEDKKHYLQGYISEDNIGGGWRVDPENGDGEFVLLCSRVEQHKGSAQMREVLSGEEVRHAKILDL